MRLHIDHYHHYHHYQQTVLAVSLISNLLYSSWSPISKLKEMHGDKNKNSNDKMFMEVAMVVLKSIETRVRMIEMNQVQRSSLLLPIPLSPKYS